MLYALVRNRLLSVVLFGVASLATPPSAFAKTSAPACPAGSEARSEAAQIWVTPRSPTAGKPLRVLVVSEESQGSQGSSEIAIIGPAGRPESTKTTKRGGPPWSTDAAVASPAPGRYVVRFVRQGKVVACRSVDVAGRGGHPAPAREPPSTGIRTASRAWDRATENFYSAWIESLFDAPVGETLGFRPLAQALRDRDRNLLFDYLGLGEDDPKGRTALVAAPDCADLPYFLRAYFSWKLGLPVGLRDCDRGTDTRPPHCGELVTNESPLEGAPKDPLGAMKKFLRLLGNKVHSGSARTALADDDTDYYPVKLTREALRPGVVFADPYGHVLMLVKWIDQGNSTGGILLAVDGQPDGSVGRKRFWEGTFLYANDVAGAGPGFKMFRPLVRGADGTLAPLGNAALRADRRFAPFSAEQSELPRESFYARMGKLINPKGLEATAAYNETLDALVEQLQTRLGSVDNGETFMREKNNPVVPMPEGAKIFETIGPWEDYATPSRDMRLQIAMHVLETLPDRIVAHPDLFNLGGRKPDVVRAEVARLHAARVKERSIEYRRSDGSPFRLTVADVLARKLGLEMAYNPNDCVEIRWGAPDGSAEAATCKRHAPDDQRARMAQVRAWFHDMRRPAR